MSSNARQRIEYNLAGRGQIALADAEELILDVCGCSAFRIYASAGTHTYQPCDKNGVVVTGSSSANFVSGTSVPVGWSHYLITADAGDPCTVCAF
jgi:hypothetical protein